MKLHVVEYSVPVLCYVDIVERKVVKVIVDDEAITMTDDVYTTNFEDVLPIDNPDRELARTIAESYSWPAWHQGF